MVATALAVSAIVGVAVAASPQLLAIVGVVIALVALTIWRPLWALMAILLLGPFFALMRAQILQVRPDVPSQLITGSISGWLVLAAIAAALHRGNSTRTLGSADLALIALILLQLPFLLLSPDLIIGLTALRVAFDGTAAYALIRFYQPSNREIWLLAIAILLSAAIVSASAVVQWALGPEYIRAYAELTLQTGVQTVGSGYVRAPSVVGSANTASWVLLLATAVSCSLVAAFRNGHLRLLLLGLACLLIAGMVVTFVRASWGGLLIAGLYLVVVNRTRHKPLILIGSVLAGVVIGAGKLFSASLPIYVQEAFQNPLYAYDSIRFSSWQNSLNSLLLNPIGHGLGTQGAVSVRFFSSGFIGSIGEGDNWYLKLALESGVIALAAFVAFLVFVFRDARLAIDGATTPAIRALVTGCAGGLAGFAAVNLFSNGWDWYPANLYYWVIAAIIVHVADGRSALIGEMRKQWTLAGEKMDDIQLGVVRRAHESYGRAHRPIDIQRL